LLKNRGYDSAGVYCKGDNTERLIKYADEPGSSGGCISKVVAEVLKEKGISTIGLAHTRWATCGARISRNAHPHSDQAKRIFLVHNGILSNHAALRTTHLPSVEMNSETDT
jgi:glucosamine--fructose-6-phosphate aminotransferase (isomerizing)